VILFLDGSPYICKKKIEMEDKIREWISEFLKTSYCKDLPGVGVLAGGSLSNWIIHKILNKQTPINDLDVFTIDSRNDSPDWTSSVSDWNASVENWGYHGHTIKYNLNKWYKIIDCKREGLLNSISVEMPTGLGYYDIIDNFDLDLCSVGYVLETGEVLFTQSFLDFVENLERTKTFSLHNLNSPDKTFIRAMKKSLELSLIFRRDDFQFLKFLVCTKDPWNKKSFSNKLAQDFKSLQISPVFTNDLKNINLVPRKDVVDFLQTKNPTLDKDLHLWSLEWKSEKQSDGDPFVERYRGMSCPSGSWFFLMNYFKATGRDWKNFKDDQYLSNMVYLMLSGWVDMEYDQIQVHKKNLDLLKKLTELSVRSFNYFRTKGMKRSIEIIDFLKNTPIWPRICSVFETCPFSLVDDYIQNSSDPLNVAYLEIISRGSKVKELVQASELENRKIPELLP
jgi:hypothetical protein